MHNDFDDIREFAFHRFFHFMGNGMGAGGGHGRIHMNREIHKDVPCESPGPDIVAAVNALYRQRNLPNGGGVYAGLIG